MSELAADAVKSKYIVTAEYTESGKAAAYLPIPKGLESRLIAYLVFKYKNTRLYKHQTLALERILGGENVVLSTPTASGKSLVFYLPVLQRLLQDQNATSIFLFPQKALSSDQEKKLKKILEVFNLPQTYLGRYDGTVKGAEMRKQIIRDARILLATPDVLHTTILRLSGEEEYRSFFQRLRYVVLDECHLYGGVFGTNMAFLMRRLRQVASWEGTEPQFIAASATIEEPAAHLTKLTGLPFVSLGREVDGSGSDGREYRLIRPGADSGLFEAAWECVKEALDCGEKVIIFLDHRQMVERLTVFIREQLGEQRAALCAPYRAGYLAGERQIIERQLGSGQVRCVVSTSAMELGIDVSGLDRCVLCGIPSDRTSFFQRIGRVGRGQGGKRGKVDIIFGGTSVDEYYFHHPELLWRQRFNPCYLNLNNERLALDHASCVNFEAQLAEERKPDAEILGPELFARLSQKPQSRSFAYAHRAIQTEIPHFELNLRSVDEPSYKLTRGELELGEISLSQVLREAYEGAIYRHAGRLYRVEKVAAGRVQVKPTQEIGTVVKPIGKTVIKRRFYSPDFQLAFQSGTEKLSVRPAWFNVTQFVIGYQQERRGVKTQHLYGAGRMLSKFMVTQGLEFICQRPEGFYPPAARAMVNAIFKATPLVCNMSVGDLAHDVFCRENKLQFRIFDNAAGGLGLSWKLASQLPAIVREAERMLSQCSNCSSTDNANGCILCCRMPTDNATDRLIDRWGGIQLAQWLLALLNEEMAKRPSQDARREVALEARRNTGFMLKEGSLVFIFGRCAIGKVVSSEAYHEQDRLYKLKLGQKEKILSRLIFGADQRRSAAVVLGLQYGFHSFGKQVVSGLRPASGPQR